MKLTPKVTRLCVAVGLVVAASTAGIAQDTSSNAIVGGPLAEPMPFVNAPFSADAITTANHALPDGTRLDHSTTARYFRDSAGRVRIELLMEGLRAPKTPSERHIRLTVCPMTDVYPGVPEPRCFTFDPVTRTVRGSTPTRPLSSGGGHILGVPVGGVRFVTFSRATEWIGRHPEAVRGAAVQEESLGTRRISGLETSGHRTSLTFPARTFGNAAPFDLVDEEWKSVELGLVIYGHYTDSRSGDVEYRLTNIRRGDPPSDLFVVPADYTMPAPKSGSANDPWISLSGPERYIADTRDTR